MFVAYVSRGTFCCCVSFAVVSPQEKLDAKIGAKSFAAVGSCLLNNVMRRMIIGPWVFLSFLPSFRFLCFFLCLFPKFLLPLAFFPLFIRSLIIIRHIVLIFLHIFFHSKLDKVVFFFYPPFVSSRFLFFLWQRLSPSCTPALISPTPQVLWLEISPSFFKPRILADARAFW